MLEAHRLLIQARLDAAKNDLERNRLGQFATPSALAREIVTHALRLREDPATPIRFLEPAVGTGAFYSALRQNVPPKLIAQATGVEVDPLVSRETAALYGQRGLHLRTEDFTRAIPDGFYNLVITNPPYVRHHHLGPADKARLKIAVRDQTGVGISGLAGLYCFFLLLCDRWLADGAVCAWLIPSEFMDVNYGAAIRDYLTRKVTLLQIHRFAPQDAQFADALVTSAVVIFRKGQPAEGHEALFSLGGRLGDPTQVRRIPLQALRQQTKWSALPDREAGRDSTRATLGDFFAVRRGVATGANGYFVLPRKKAEALGIPEEFRRPILPSSRQLADDIVESGENGYPLLAEPLSLIDCRVPEEELRAHHPAFYRYLQRGTQEGVDQGYLTSRRRPWYSQEDREPAPFLCSYMGRGTAERSPFRIVWNRSQAIAANVWLMLYPKGALARLIDAEPAQKATVFTALRQLGTAQLTGEGRVYGGGLHKLEPRELERVSADSLTEAFPVLNVY